jgi:phosphohistidine phosphatase SixA
MKVFLLRHTEAAYGGPDPKRQLTPSGQHVARQLAQHINGNPFFSFSEVWVSPYTRAQQTAKPVLESLDPTPRVASLDELIPHGVVQPLIDRLSQTDDSVLLVGHNPLLANLAKSLIGIPQYRTFSFKKGALLALKRDPNNLGVFSLSALITPASLGIRP